MIEVLLNGKTVAVEPGTTILELARREGLQIPTLCHDEELNPYGSCWVCAVEVKGRKGFVTSCGTTVSPGMEIVTDSPEIQAARKMALELLISNHYADCEAPCKVACPDHVDIQSYVSLIANGQYHEAVKVIKETLPLPLSIGRVCPAFCEKECRRQIVEDPIAIRQLKRYAADEDLADFWTYIPEKEAEKPQKVAIIGAGPSGLTCGFYLSNQGYSVDVFESNPQAGGWLRYGIPEYRLPKAILDREIELLCVNGMKIHYNQALGKDLSLQSLAADYDAVYLALGAQKAVPMPVKGSDLEGCYLGVDFLKAHALKEAPKLGKRVAVVGGGNTAIDCARTALRLGSEVTIIYRRTRDEMPAEPYEIEAAVHEGVELLLLTNPVEYKGQDGKLCSVTLEKMQLGEPDKSGRRRPEPTGEFFEEDFDTIIAAISQVPEIELFAEEENKIGTDILPLSRWSTAIVDESSMWTGLRNVFAGGDFRRGAATAIEAIADGRLAAEAIGSFLETGEIKAPGFRFDAKKAHHVQDVSPAEFAQYEKIKRISMPELPVAEASRSFKEVELGFTEEQARKEADCCLECGCQVNESCSLRQYCTDYQVEASKFLGSINKHPIDHSHPFILRDANKCINCGRCVRTCSEIQGAAVLGFIYRGFSSVVAPEFGESLTETTCESCGKCIAVCPVGALVEKNANYKLNPLLRENTLQSCGICGTGCLIQSQTQTNEVVLIQAPQKDEDRGFNGRNLCFNGRFGWQTLYAPQRLKLPRYKENGIWKDISWAEARRVMAQKTPSLKNCHFEISPRISLEEMLMLKAVANTRSAKLYASPALQPLDSSLYSLKPDHNAYDKLDRFSEYVVVGKISHTLRTLLRVKQRQGKRLVLVNPPEAGFNRLADKVLHKLDELEPSAGQLFIYNLNELSPRQIYSLYTVALQLDPSGENLWVGSNYANYWGLLALQPCFNLPAEAEFALGWGCYPANSDKATFSVAIQLFADDEAPVDLLLPAPSYLEIEAHTLGDMARPGLWMNPAKSMIINELMRVFYELGWIPPSTAEINHWNLKVEELMAVLASRQVQNPSVDGLNPDTLSNEAAFPQYELDLRIKRLYESRRNT